MKYDIVKLMARRKIRWKKRWVSGDSGGRLTFRSKKAGRLSDYRIYGNTVGGESVGDLVESGEHAGEYKVPVTVEGKNLLQNTATSQTIKGVTFTVNADKSVTCNGTATDVTFFTISMTINQGSYIVSGAPAGCNLETPYVTIRLRTPSGGGDVPPFNNNDFGMGVTISSDKNNNNDYLYKIRVPKDYTCDNFTFYPMIRRADIEDDTYEPYHAPVTTPLYLPEPIKMVGDEAEYIDYAEQKMHRIGADDINVTLPALPTLMGTNVLSVGTAVQPSRVEVKGRIKAVGQETEPEQEAAEPEPETAEPEQEAAEAEQEAAEAEQE